MFQPLSTSVRFIAITSAFALAFLLTESANAQGRYGPYAGGPVSRGMNTAQPWPIASPGYVRATPPGAMIHPSASPYLFQSGTSGGVTHSNAMTTASFPATGVMDIPFNSGQQLGYSQSPQFSPNGSRSIGDGCFTETCGSVGDLMPFHWIQAVGGNEYGVSHSWYKQFGIFAPIVVLPDESGLSFLQANGTIADGEVYGANVGLVTRYRDPVTY